MGKGSSFLYDSSRLPKRKPHTTARRVSLFRREVHIGLSSAAVEILFDRASVLSEGARDGDGYFGSTMITFDCARAAHLVSDSCDAETVRRVRDLVGNDARVRERARRLGTHEAERLSGAMLLDPHVEMRVRANGHHLHIDLDIEATAARTL